MLDRQVLYDRLDDPVCFGNAAEIVLDIAGLDELGLGRMHEPAGLDLLRNPRLGGGAPPAPITRDVQEQHGHAAFAN